MMSEQIFKTEVDDNLQERPLFKDDLHNYKNLVEAKLSKCHCPHKLSYTYLLLGQPQKAKMALGGGKEQSVVSLWLQSKIAKGLGELTTAEGLAYRALEKAEGFSKHYLYQLLGELSYQKGDYKRAIEYFERAYILRLDTTDSGLVQTTLKSLECAKRSYSFMPSVIVATGS